MKNKILFIIAVILFMLGCSRPSTNEEIVIVGPLSFKTNKREKIFMAKGIDSDVKKIALNGGDTLIVEFGKHVFNLKEDYISVMSPHDKQEWEALTKGTIGKDYLIVSENAEEEAKYGIFLNNYYMYDTLSGIVAIVVQPKKTGHGITGIYIPKLRGEGSFSMYGIDLDSASQLEAMEIIRSIHYAK